MRLFNQSTGDAHNNGDCWPPSCPICELEDAYEAPNTDEEDDE